MYLAIIACANGLGHVRRVVAISSFMLKNGFGGMIDAYLPQSHIKCLSKWPECSYFVNHKRVHIHDFNYPAKSICKTIKICDHDWITIDLPALSKYDVVWSDNILQVLEQRDDAIITGSFFWHEVLEKHAEARGQLAFIKAQRELLSVRPTMVGNEYFAMPEVIKQTNFIPVGLYRYSLLLREKRNRGILISCGLGGEEENVTKETIQRIIDEQIRPPDLLFVEPRLLPEKYPGWIKKADFSDEMYHHCAAVCIRPGIGTISDALISHNMIFAFSRSDSAEMTHNSRVLEHLNVGEQSKCPFDAYISALQFVDNPENINKQLLKTSHLRTDGVFATAKVIFNRSGTR